MIPTELKYMYKYNILTIVPKRKEGSNSMVVSMSLAWWNQIMNSSVYMFVVM